MRTLVAGGCVLTMDAARTRFEDGYVLIDGGAIAAVGPAAEAPDSATVEETIDARGCVVTPGLVNTHQHHWYGLFRGLGGGMLLEQWIEDLLLPAGAALTPADVRAASRLACLGMIATGTTTCLNHSTVVTDEAWAEAALEPVVETGMRQLFGKELRPDDLDGQLALAEQLHGRWHGAGGGRVRLALAIETTAHWVAHGTCSEELVHRGDALAARLGLRVTDHIAGGTMSRERGYLRFVLETGRTDLEFLHGLGVLDEKWVLAHALNVTDRDIALIAASGAAVSHTPTSESIRGGGIAPIRRFRDAGIPVALGTDGPMVDGSLDMLEQAKVALLLQNQLHRDPCALGVEDALAMATCEAARVLGLDAEIGSLEAGKRADLAVFPLDTVRAAPFHDPLAALLQCARGADARWVLVDGEPLVRDGALARYDGDAQQAIVAEARARAEQLLRRARVPAAEALRARRAAGRPAASS